MIFTRNGYDDAEESGLSVFEADDEKAKKEISQTDKDREVERGKRLNVEIPEELHYQVKMKAAERSLSLLTL